MADTQVFLHVLGAITLFGATSAVAVLAFLGRGREEQLPLARASFFTLLLLAIPAWVVTLAFGYWTESAQKWPDVIGWIELGAGEYEVLVEILPGAGDDTRRPRAPLETDPTVSWPGELRPRRARPVREAFLAERMPLENSRALVCDGSVGLETEQS